jgi:hypothetical protein
MELPRAPEQGFNVFTRYDNARWWSAADLRIAAASYQRQ